MRHASSNVHMPIFVQYNVVCVCASAPVDPGRVRGANVHLKLLAGERGDSTLLVLRVLPGCISHRES